MAFYPRTRLTLEQKVKLLEESMFPDFDPEEARQRYKIGKTCYFTILRNRKEILKTAEQLGSQKMKQVNKKADLEEELYSWILDKNQNGIAVTSSMIRTKAAQLVPGFNPGPKAKWFHAFKKRYNIIYKTDTKSFFAIKPSTDDEK